MSLRHVAGCHHYFALQVLLQVRGEPVVEIDQLARDFVAGAPRELDAVLCDVAVPDGRAPTRTPLYREGLWVRVPCTHVGGGVARGFRSGPRRCSPSECRRRRGSQVIPPDGTRERVADPVSHRVVLWGRPQIPLALPGYDQLVKEGCLDTLIKPRGSNHPPCTDQLVRALLYDF